MKTKFIVFIFSIVTLFITFTMAQGHSNLDFEIIPSGSSNAGDVVDSIRKGGSVRERYKNAAYGQEVPIGGERKRVGTSLTLGEQFASGVMSRDTILDYVVYLVKFLGQLALLAGAVMIIFYGYKKATEHFKFGGTLGKVITGILVISFAYVIVKMIWSMFIS